MEFVHELSGFGHAEESGRAVEGIGCGGGQSDAARDVGEERGYKGGGGRVFEERIVGGACVGGFGVFDHGQERGVEPVEEVDDEGRVSSAVGNGVLAGHEHVVVSCDTSKLASRRVCGPGRDKHRFASGEAFAKASKPRVERRMSMLDVGVKTEEALVLKKDGSAV